MEVLQLYPKVWPSVGRSWVVVIDQEFGKSVVSEFAFPPRDLQAGLSMQGMLKVGGSVLCKNLNIMYQLFVRYTKDQ